MVLPAGEVVGGEFTIRVTSSSGWTAVIASHQAFRVVTRPVCATGKDRIGLSGKPSRIGQQ